MAALGLAFACPLAAQDGHAPQKRAEAEKSPEAVAELMKSLFQVEPLTAEQRARLPQAQAVIAKMMPPGTLQQMMGGMFDKMLGPMMAMASEASSADIARELGVDPDTFELDDEEAARIAAIVDPAWKERRELEAAAVQRGMTAAMTAMEPAMRKGMADAYAATFTTAELTDIDAFFTTPSGAAFARKSYALSSDPRIMAAAMEGMPAMMAGMKAMEAEVKTATARLPARRGYADLTPEQRAEIGRLTGLQPGALRKGMERAAAERAEKEAPNRKVASKGTRKPKTDTKRARIAPGPSLQRSEASAQLSLSVLVSL